MEKTPEDARNGLHATIAIARKYRPRAAEAEIKEVVGDVSGK